jgi:hypothetical protein
MSWWWQEALISISVELACDFTENANSSLTYMSKVYPTIQMVVFSGPNVNFHTLLCWYTAPHCWSVFPSHITFPWQQLQIQLLGILCNLHRQRCTQKDLIDCPLIQVSNPPQTDGFQPTNGDLVVWLIFLWKLFVTQSWMPEKKMESSFKEYH